MRECTHVFVGTAVGAKFVALFFFVNGKTREIRSCARCVAPDHSRGGRRALFRLYWLFDGLGFVGQDHCVRIFALVSICATHVMFVRDPTHTAASR